MDEKEYDKFENIINDLHDGTDEVKYVFVEIDTIFEVEFKEGKINVKWKKYGYLNWKISEKKIWKRINLHYHNSRI